MGRRQKKAVDEGTDNPCGNESEVAIKKVVFVPEIQFPLSISS